MAVGKRNGQIVASTRGWGPEAALAYIQKAIVECATFGHWDEIVDPKTQPHLFRGLWSYFETGAFEVFKPGQIVGRARAKHALYNQIRDAIENLPSVHFDTTVFASIASSILGDIEATTYRENAASIFALFSELTMARKFNDEGRPVKMPGGDLNKHIVNGLEHLRDNQIFWMFEILEKSDHSLREELLAFLWQNLTLRKGRHSSIGKRLLTWQRILRPLIDLENDERFQGVEHNNSKLEVGNACVQTTGRICNFAVALKELPALIRKLNVPFNLRKIDVDSERCRVKSILFEINNQHSDLWGKLGRDQWTAAMAARQKVQMALKSWTDQYLIPSFPMAVNGDLVEIQEKKQEKKIPFSSESIEITSVVGNGN